MGFYKIIIIIFIKSSAHSYAMNKTENDKYKYRRQFIITRKPIEALQHWTKNIINGSFVYSHPDLSATVLETGSQVFILLGDWFDYENTEYSNYNILKNVSGSVLNYENIFEKIKIYSGNFVLLYADSKDFIAVQDSLSLRELYYLTNENQVICGSQPLIIKEFSNPKVIKTENDIINRFYEKEMPLVRNGRLWVGDETLFQNIKHLLPNHFLDINKKNVFRYWPRNIISRKSVEEIVEQSCEILQGTMKALTHRFNIMLAVTAGHDSRTLLAATKKIKNEIYYFINNRGRLKCNSPDIRIPKNIFRDINKPFHIHQVEKSVDETFKDYFFNNVFLAKNEMLPTVYNVYEKNHSNKVNVLGVGEIGRALWGDAPKVITPYYLAYVLNYKNSVYAVEQCSKWLKEVNNICTQYDININTLLLWEQLLGNWGAVGNSESDISIEEYDPFNSHLMYENLLSVNIKSICNPEVLFHEMIKYMWPELLKYPINPPFGFVANVKQILKRLNVFVWIKRGLFHCYYLYYKTIN